MKQMLQIGMIVIVLMGTIGIPFYQHTCLHENKVMQSVFVPSHECSKDHDEVKVQVSPCCAAPKAVVSPSEESVSDNCCLDEVSNWQFSFFFFQSVNPVFSEALEEISILKFCPYFDVLVWENEDETFFSGADPPALNVLERLTHLCIWRL